jgi:hypothetical protein
VFPGLSMSVSVGIPSATDPHGVRGAGPWWMTGNLKPALLPEPTRRRRRWRLRRRAR